MKEKEFKKCVVDNWCFAILSFISVAMLIASFLCPPMGVIDGSVLTAVGEIFAFTALGTVYKAIVSGMDAKFKRNGTEIEIQND